MNQENWDGLIGQLTANAAVMQALLVTVIGLDPLVRQTVERQVEVAALVLGSQLSPAQLTHFRDQMQSYREAIQQA